MSLGSGGLMQLVAYGAQDLYLTGNPSITFFKMVYRRYTNFSAEPIELFFQVTPSFQTTQRTKGTIRLSRHGDLVGDVYLVYDTPNIYSNKEYNFQWVDYLGNQIIHSVEVLIDGMLIDRQYGQWLTIWNELSLPIGRRRAYYEMIGETPEMHPKFYAKEDVHLAIPGRRLYIPLGFWFCQSPGLAIPLVALQYQEVFIQFEFTPLNDLFTIGDNPRLSPKAFFSDLNTEGNNVLLREKLEGQGYATNNVFHKFVREWKQNVFLDANYYFLDTDERRLYAQTTHEYLIGQVQRNYFQGLREGPNTVELEFHNPSKELIWVLRRDPAWIRNDWNNYTRIDEPGDWHKLKELSEKGTFDTLERDQFLDSIEVMDFVGGIRPAEGSCRSDEHYSDGTSIFQFGTLIFNGHERLAPRDYRYFSNLIPYKYHSALPRIDGIMAFPFALLPEDLPPSGSANFSRLDKVQMRTNLAPGGPYELVVFNRSINVLRIMAGMGGIVFAN